MKSPAPVPAPAPAPARSAAVFETGSVLASRYRVVRFVAQGGMGEVYEVEDLSLGGRLALKTIRPEIADDPKAAERFKREVFLARKITHQNVCRLHDLGVHRVVPAVDPMRLDRLTVILTGELA